MNEINYNPDLIHHLRAYMKGCHICQLYRNEMHQTRQLQHKIKPSYKAMKRLGMHLKLMLTSYRG